MLRRRKGKWSLRAVLIEVKLFIFGAKVLFVRDPPPKRRPARRRKAPAIVVQAREMPPSIVAPQTAVVTRPPIAIVRPIRPYGIRHAPASMDSPFHPHLIGATAVLLIDRERRKAVKRGDALPALLAAVAQKVIVDSMSAADRAGSSGWS